MYRSNSSGFVALAVISILLVIIVTSFSSVGEFFTQNRLTASKQTRENRMEFIDALDETIMDTAVAVTRDIGGGTLACNTVATNFSGRWPRTFRNMTWELWPGTGVTGDDPKRTDAITRCPTRQKFLPTDNYSGNNTIYFCLKLSANGATEKIPNMLLSGPVFAEAAISMKNVGTNNFVNCANYTTVPVLLRGGTVTFTLYWMNRITGKDVAFSETQRRIFLTN